MRNINNKNEIEFTERLMAIAADEARKSTCKKSQRGAVIVKDSVVIGKGYNEPQDEKYCNPCIREGIKNNSQIELCSAVHAEWMAILDVDDRKLLENATIYHIKLKYGKIAPSSEPSCTVCSRIILKSKMKEFIMLTNKGFIAYTPQELNDLSYKYFLDRIKAASN